MTTVPFDDTADDWAARRQGEVYGNARIRATYAELAAETGWTNNENGMVTAADTGTHASATGDIGASGGQTPNSGYYAYSTALTALVRVGALESVTSQASATAAAGSAVAAEAAAAEALVTLADVVAEGAIQILAVSNAGAAVTQTATTYADALSTGEVAPAYESIGVTTSASLSSNVGVHQVGLVNGTHVATGDVIRGIQWAWACAATTATVEIKVWKRDVAGATGAGTLNNAAPIATHDALVATYSTTPSVIGITVGTTNPAKTNVYTLPSTFTVEAGFDYVFQFRNLDGSSVVVNCGFMYFSAAAGTQRRAGFQALTATPTTFTSLTTTRSPAITLLKAKSKTTLPATDAILRTLLNQRDATTLAVMNQRNVDNLYINATLFPNVLANPASFWGDSLTQDSNPGVGFKAVEGVDAVTSGTVNNYGIGGETASQITTRVSAASAADKAGFNQVLMGANDTLDAAKTAALIVADYATCAAAFTNANYLMCATWSSGVVSRKHRDVWRSLRSTYGAKALDMPAMWSRFGAQASDAAESRRGALPTGLCVDTLHQNQPGGLIKGHAWAAALIARNGGAPFVHDDMFGFKAGDASGAAIATVRTLGTGYNFSILAGNEDGAVDIARGTGAITRTAATILQPYREIFVEAENNKGKGRNGRIVLVQQMDGTSPQKAVRVIGNGASILRTPTTFAPADGTQLTIVVCMRVDTRRTNGYLLSQGTNSIITQSGSGNLFVPRTAGGTSLGSISVTPSNPSDWHVYFYTLNTATGVIAAACDETSSTGAASVGNVSIASITTFFGNESNSLPWAGDLKMLAIYDTYYDITNTAVRANWYDSATRLPKDIGDGTAGGALAAPLVYLRGMAGDYLLGKNFGTGGDLHAPVPIGAAHLGFSDIEA